MVTFINMVITRVKNGSPDMILTAFEGKFDKNKKMRYLPRFVNLIFIKHFNIGNFGVDIKHKNDHKSGPWGYLMARIWHAPYYHTLTGFFKPKGPQF